MGRLGILSAIASCALVLVSPTGATATLDPTFGSGGIVTTAIGAELDSIAALALQADGVDIIQWDESGRICDFKVMIRPLKAINLLHQKMAEILQLMGGKN